MLEHSFTYLLTHTYAHTQKGVILRSQQQVSFLFSFLSTLSALNFFLSLFFAFSHIETTPNQISYPSQVFPPKNGLFPDYV